MKRPQALRVIALAWLVAGVLDITSAFVIATLKGTGSIRMLQGIASGLLGRSSFDGGFATAGLGLGIHFFIALVAVLAFYIGQLQNQFFDAAADSFRIALRNCGLPFHVLGGDSARFPNDSPFVIREM